ncbi:unnamed protein product, partial [Ixodes pacificus]
MRSCGVFLVLSSGSKSVVTVLITVLERCHSVSLSAGFFSPGSDPFSRSPGSSCLGYSFGTDARSGSSSVSPSTDVTRCGSSFTCFFFFFFFFSFPAASFDATLGSGACS